jgi:hypothetical protein
MSVAFICATCKVSLTLPVQPLADHRLERQEDGRPRVPRGSYRVEDSEGPEDGWHVVNLEDVIHTKYHEDYKRLSGCCGISGLDGKTTLCANGHEVGVEHSDCWQPHGLSLDPQAVEVKRQD